MDRKLDGKGIVSFSRVSGRQDLYEVIENVGSYIKLSISTARESGFYGETNTRPHETLIEVALSPVQFASAITQMNVGEGHPCTISYFDKEYIEYTKDGVNEFESYIEKAMDAVGKTIKPSVDEERLVELIEGLRINKATRKEIMELIKPTVQHRISNRKFALQRVEEILEKRVSRAKTDIQAHAEMMLMSTGIMATNQLMAKGEKLKIEEEK